jgi:hypothetical protein
VSAQNVASLTQLNLFRLLAWILSSVIDARVAMAVLVFASGLNPDESRRRTRRAKATSRDRDKRCFLHHSEKIRELPNL